MKAGFCICSGIKFRFALNVLDICKILQIQANTFIQLWDYFSDSKFELYNYQEHHPLLKFRNGKISQPEQIIKTTSKDL